MPTDKIYEQKYKYKTWEIALFFFITAFIFIFVIYGIYFFLRRSKGKTVGGSCNSDNNCRPYHYCSGAFTCQSGSSGSTGFCTKDEDCVVGTKCLNQTCQNGSVGGTNGQPCTINSECAEGYLCRDFICIKESDVVDEYGSFINADITFNNKGTLYYLHITSQKSFWSLNKPTYGYSYDAVNKRLCVVKQSNTSSALVSGISVSSDEGNKLYSVVERNIRQKNGIIGKIMVRENDNYGGSHFEFLEKGSNIVMLNENEEVLRIAYRRKKSSLAIFSDSPLLDDTFIKIEIR